MPDSFSKSVVAKLKYYVYRLIDPRNGETFYVGKGKGNRVFAHTQGKISSDDPSLKLRRIRDITNSGLEVAHIIHRHGMDEKTAFEVEAALIDAYPGLTNAVGGFGSNEFGSMHSKEVINKYNARIANIQHKAILINISRTESETSLYEATRYAWKISQKKAEQAELIFAVSRGLIVEVFVADAWLPATSEYFPGRETIPGRKGFIGKVASDAIRKKYRKRRIPDEYRKRGAANPIKYTFK